MSSSSGAAGGQPGGLPPLPKLRPRPGLVRDTNETSRLLTKDECNGGKRGKSGNVNGGSGNGSQVHSIPKFSQVRPNTRLTAVQKVLQSRIMSKIAKKRQLEMQREAAERRKREQQRQEQRQEEGDLRARNLLQNMILMKEDDDDGSGTNKSGNGKRRGRKPAKDEICRLMPRNNNYSSNNNNNDDTSTSTRRSPVQQPDVILVS